MRRVFLCTANGGGRRTEAAAQGTQQNSGHQVSTEETREDSKSGASELTSIVLAIENKRINNKMNGDGEERKKTRARPLIIRDFGDIFGTPWQVANNAIVPRVHLPNSGGRAKIFTASDSRIDLAPPTRGFGNRISDRVRSANVARGPWAGVGLDDQNRLLEVRGLAELG